MKETLLDKFIRWVDGDMKVLMGLAATPLSILMALIVSDYEVGQTLWFGRIVELDSQLKIYTYTSMIWGIAAFSAATVMRVKSYIKEGLALVAGFLAAFIWYLFI